MGIVSIGARKISAARVFFVYFDEFLRKNKEETLYFCAIFLYNNFDY